MQRVFPKVIRMVAELPATWGDASQGRVSADQREMGEEREGGRRSDAKQM
jgi:hypothetical protein